MAAILDLPEIRASVHRWTVADYRRLTEDEPAFRHSELICGIIIEKMPKSPLHQYLTGLICEILRSCVRAGLLIRQEAPLQFADSVPEPDISVVHGAAPDFRTRHPATAELVVEIAVTSMVLDREKARLYAAAAVAEYWIVLGEEDRVEVYRLPVNGVYQTKRIYGRGESIEGLSITDQTVPVESLFA